MEALGDSISSCLVPLSDHYAQKGIFLIRWNWIRTWLACTTSERETITPLGFIYEAEAVDRFWQITSEKFLPKFIYPKIKLLRPTCMMQKLLSSKTEQKLLELEVNQLRGLNYLQEVVWTTGSTNIWAYIASSVLGKYVIQSCLGPLTIRHLFSLHLTICCILFNYYPLLFVQTNPE